VDDDIFILALVLNTVFLAGGVLVILMAMYQRGRNREMQHRERLAMIERGLAPAPEQNPAAFDALARPRHPPATSIGVVIAALGLGLMMLIGAAAQEWAVAIGLGAAIIVLGAAFIILGALQRGSQPQSWGSRSYSPPRPPASSDQPGPFGP
jgi:hypothetical protein